MRKLTIEAPPERKIEINGVVYDVLPTDFEIISMAEELIAQCEALAGGGTSIAEAAAAIKNVLSIIDRILGEGASKEILNGRSANLNFMLTHVFSPILREILIFAGEGYEKRIEEEFGIRPLPVEPKMSAACGGESEFEVL